jgi:elongation factor G
MNYGNVAPAFVAARAGYDVWLGNSRGNTYSCKHVKYDPWRNEAKFWDFDWMDMGQYDIPASLDYITSLTGQPKVAYRETITKKIEIDYTHKKQSGGSGQFAKVKIAFEPLPSDAKDNFEFTSEVVGGRVPKEYIPGVEKGLKSAKDTGFLAGFPVVRLKTTLLDGAYHDVDSSVLAFEIAARSAFREAMEKAGPIILEPIMKVEVVTPEDYMGDVIGDINSRRGQIQNLEGRDVAQVITAKVPLAAMFGYVNNLRSLSQGRASYSMEFDCYEAVPSAVAEEIKAKKA